MEREREREREREERVAIRQWHIYNHIALIN
jgi:hypothetical protein